MPSATEPGPLRCALAPAPAWPAEPYKGLNFFCANDAPLFSQREEEIEDCATRVDDFVTRVLLLHGLSGTGKSSFLRAGLIPRLQEPPDQGCCKFFFLGDCAGESILIRATDDPIARIHETLTEAARNDERIPQAARVNLQDALNAPLPADRKLAADVLIAALKPLTTGLRYTFVLVVDQAEEVLTLPQRSEGPFNRRVGFFYFLEELCHQRMDMRAIVAFRTEYYGQFCSFFRIPSTLSVTSAALPRAGLVDYLLRRIDNPAEIAAAIQRPTLTEPAGGLAAPRRTYGFEYEPGLAEHIARDLVDHSGDASTLPVMQIVCKDLYERVCRKQGRSLITPADYEGIGCAEGALDSHIDNAIRGALAEAGCAESSAANIERWRLVFADHLVGRQEGGAVTTLIATEGILIAAAIEQGIEGDSVPVLRAMAQERWRVLRPVKRPGGAGEVYSLGHDCLGPPLSRWSEKHGERLRADEEAERRFERERREAATRLMRQQRESRFKMALAGAAVAVLGAAGLVVLQSTYLPRQQAVTVLNSVATQQGSNHLRERLLLLVSSLQKSAGWPWSWAIGSEAAREELRETLLRAPVFGGAFPAGLNGEGTRLAYFDYHEGDGRLSILDLATGQPTEKPIQSKTRGLVDSRSMRPLAVGFVAAEPRREAVAIGGSTSEYLIAMPGATGLQHASVGVPERFLANATFPPQPDFAGGMLRLLGWSVNRGLIDSVGVLPVSTAAEGSAIRMEAGEPYMIDWQAARRNARRIPALAEDCAAYAFIGREDERLSDYQPMLWTGLAGNPAEAHPLGIRLPQGDQALSSLGFARGCGAVLIRTPGRLAVFDLTGNRLSPQAEEQVFALPDGLRGFMLSSFPQMQPPLAVSPLEGDGWRAAWLVDSGLGIADLRPGKREAEALLTDSRRRAVPFLTGLDAASNVGRITISRSGEFLLISQQRSFAAKPEVRAFDLRLDRRRRALATADLRREACRVAAFLSDGNQLKPDELVAWLGDEHAKQPCSN